MIANGAVIHLPAAIHEHGLDWNSHWQF